MFDVGAARFQADYRVLGALNFGSVGRSHEDELSDVDPLFLVRDEDFAAVHADLRSIFDSLCPPICLW